MKGYLKMSCLVAGMCLTAGAITANAQESVVDLAYPSHAYTKDAQSILLAANDAPQDTAAKKSVPPLANTDFKESWFTGAKVHQYLGLATIVAAVATAASAPGEGCEQNCAAVVAGPRDVNGTHAKLGKATRNLALATVVSGLISHWDDFKLEDGWSDPDNLHVLLGVSGALAMTYAVNKSANSATPVSHSGIAELGALAMAIGIRITW